MSLRSRTNSPALSDGEVLSGDEEKAISTTTAKRNSSVNTSTRPTNGSSSRAWQKLEERSADPYLHSRVDEASARLSQGRRERSRSPFRKERSRSRSPYRPGKAFSGEKRRREDDHYNVKAGSDTRRFKVHYEDKQTPSGAANGNPVHASGYGRLAAPPDHGSDRSRNRSRSPYRADGHRDMLPVSRRESTPPLANLTNSIKVKMSLPQQGIASSKSGAQNSRASVTSAESPADESGEQQPKLSEAVIIEQRRKRREAIKARHKSQPDLLVQALEHNSTTAPATPSHESSGAPSEQQSPPSSLGSPQTPHHDSPPMSPAAFAVTDDEELAGRHQDDVAMHEDEGPSAADYDPNMDMQEDRPDHKKQTIEAAIAPEREQQPEPTTQSGKDFDMFADDDDDMFAPTDSAANIAPTTKHAKTLDSSLLDNWDYPDGHYRVILGELLDERYAVQQQIGKGTFATVVKAIDERTGLPVAIKIAANNETMYKAGQKEMDFLKLLNEADPEDKKHVIRLLRSFDHKGHMCIVFEALSADLRDVLKKFGRNVGLNLKAIRSYTQQMFLSLSHMKRCQILHADLKPDNILVSERRNLLKVCDLGTAAFATDTELTPYLVSRFYRAPEVILGMPFDYAIDMWSIGCTLFELYTGRILFAGADNNQMLRVIQECRGKIPIRMLKQSHPDQRDRHFDVENNFFSQERDKVTGKLGLRQMNFKSSGEAGKDVRSRLSHNAKGLAPAELKEHVAFVDLLDKCLQLDPAKRISPNDALRHGFVAHSIATPAPATHRVVPAMSVPRAR
ncbi:hypothetical protein LTR62_001847 [Meristemomyces frigidus]|uniref:non-specific serine/threonine protein kinase n=1 Tax=Meristemomyces frigidus TaxID=1508187 RepID=A0AAN7T7X6_9PEZI|nr:hypothetical protein LTR62_001847 [Meristemomyces frigidus]